MFPDCYFSFTFILFAHIKTNPAVKRQQELFKSACLARDSIKLLDFIEMSVKWLFTNNLEGLLKSISMLVPYWPYTGRCDQIFQSCLFRSPPHPEMKADSLGQFHFSSDLHYFLLAKRFWPHACHIWNCNHVGGHGLLEARNWLWTNNRRRVDAGRMKGILGGKCSCQLWQARRSWLKNVLCRKKVIYFYLQLKISEHNTKYHFSNSKYEMILRSIN